MKHHQERLADTFVAVEGLSVGDGFGRHARFAGQPMEVLTKERPSFPPPWEYSDDTEMALAILPVLQER
ncbi:MAG: ADP-ribosylglycohydrolase family protein [Blastocatellia bacterium]|nr:ADP-ribosylglycohydrolase family protein [Blastocatellia bacterium]